MIPHCKCHRKPMVWETRQVTNAKAPNRGYWRCRVKRQEKDRRRYATLEDYVVRRRRRIAQTRARYTNQLEELNGNPPQ